MTPEALAGRLARFPRAVAAHTPTPLEPLPRLGASAGIDLWVKRDDCTGLAFGGNKVRQLEWYVGAALAEGADTLLITSAVQSNFMRTAAAMARRHGLDIRLQLEDRVRGLGPAYRRNGNLLLDVLLGADFHTYPEGEDEAGADAAVSATAAALRDAGQKPYAIPLAADKPPTGALGYVDAAIEIAAQLRDLPAIDGVAVGSGSALTHAGVLTGLRALGIDTPVIGMCVRRNAEAQAARVLDRCQALEAMLDLPARVTAKDVVTDDRALAPGYGQLNPATRDAISKAARLEGLFLDPVYTGKVMAALLGRAKAGERWVFWHTGGQPALFAYADDLVAEGDWPV